MEKIHEKFISEGGAGYVLMISSLLAVVCSFISLVSPKSSSVEIAFCWLGAVGVGGVIGFMVSYLILRYNSIFTEEKNN